MAKILFKVSGVGETPAELPVTFNPQSITLLGLEAKTVAFDITNILGRDVTFTSVKVTVTGAGASSIKAVVRFDSFVIPAGGVFNNFLDIESTDLVLEGQAFEITVEADEAVIN